MAPIGESLGKVAAWAKSHPVLAGGIVLAVIAIAYLASRGRGAAAQAAMEGQPLEEEGFGSGAGEDFEIVTPEYPPFGTIEDPVYNYNPPAESGIFFPELESSPGKISTTFTKSGKPTGPGATSTPTDKGTKPTGKTSSDFSKAPAKTSVKPIAKIVSSYKPAKPIAPGPAKYPTATAI